MSRTWLPDSVSAEGYPVNLPPMPLKLGGLGLPDALVQQRRPCSIPILDSEVPRYFPEGEIPRLAHECFMQPALLDRSETVC